MPHQSRKYSQDTDGLDIELIRNILDENMESLANQLLDAQRTVKRRRIDSEYFTEEQTIVDLRAQLQELKRAKEAETERAIKAEAKKENAKKAGKEIKDALTEELERVIRLVQVETLAKDKAKRAEQIAIAKVKKAESALEEMTKERDVLLTSVLEKDLQLKKVVDFYNRKGEELRRYINDWDQIEQSINNGHSPTQPQNTITTDNTIISEVKTEPDSDWGEDSEENDESPSQQLQNTITTDIFEVKEESDSEWDDEIDVKEESEESQSED